MSKKKQLSNQTIIDSYDYLGRAASATDCTGLIPSAPQSRSELEAYEEVYSFRPECVPGSEKPDALSGK